MCGIAGVMHFADRYPPPSVDLLQAMIRSIQHRGPDEFGVYRDAHAGLASARLSIVDLATGQQPMSNEDETLWIVFNGEIFNYVELRKELENAGHRFRTHSDTEVVVHSYEQWGDTCFSRFNGQWALALWDTKHRRLTLSRDRVGVRPLYVREQPRRLWFGSEVKAIFADPVVPRRIDPKGLDQVVTYWAPVAPTTVFEGIEELRPGSVRTYEYDGKKKDWLFWEPSFNVRPDDAPPHSMVEAAEMLREKLMEATRLRVLRADVPVGSYLSGGIDSSVVAWMGRQAKSGSFKTFSVRFEDSEFDETNYQRLMAGTLESEHDEFVVTKRDIADAFPDVIAHAERPILRTAPAPLYLLSKRVRDAGIKTVLTGEGADEFLGGYDLFREAKIRKFWASQPGSRARPMLFERIYPYLARSPQKAKKMSLEFWGRGLDRSTAAGFSHEPRWSTTSMLKKFYSPTMRTALEMDPAKDFLKTLPNSFADWDFLSQAQYIEIATLFSGYIISSQGDRMLMGHSVEGRFPFLDINIIEFCNSLPDTYKLPGLNEKQILKTMAKGKIPQAIIARKKQPYRAPDAVSFFGPGAPDYVAACFSEERVSSSGLFDPRTVHRLYEKCSTHSRNGKLLGNSDNMAFVGILSSQLLHKRLVEGGCAKWQTIELTTLVDRAGTYQPTSARKGS